MVATADIPPHTAQSPLLLTLFCPCETLNDDSPPPSLDLLVGVFHQFRETARQFSDPFCLAPLNGLGWNQFGADPNRGSTCQNETGGRLLVHPPGSDQRDLRQSGVQRLNVIVTPDRPAGEDLDEVSASAPRPVHFCRCQRSRQDRDVFLGNELHNRGVKGWGSYEARSSANAFLCGFNIKNCTCTDSELSLGMAEMRNQLDRS